MTARLRELASRHRELVADYLSHGVYGSVIALAVVAVLAPSEPPAHEAIVSILGAGIAVVLAEVYSGRVGQAIRLGRELTPAEKKVIWRESLGGLLGALVPIVFFVLAVLDVVSDGIAFELAIWAGVAVIGVYAFFASRLSGGSLPRSLVHGLGGTAIGLGLVALKVIFH